MPLFISINDVNINNSNQAVKELILYKIDNEFKNAIEHAMAAPIKPLDSAPKK